MTRVRSSPSSAKRHSLQLLTFSLSAIRDLSSAIVLRSPHSAVRNSSSFILSSRFSSEKVSDRLSPDKLLTEGYNFAVSASEIIRELPKLSEAERRAVRQGLLEIANQDSDVSLCNQAALAAALVLARAADEHARRHSRRSTGARVR